MARQPRSRVDRVRHEGEPATVRRPAVDVDRALALSPGSEGIPTQRFTSGASLCDEPAAPLCAAGCRSSAAAPRGPSVPPGASVAP
jgi:hypothetical protein